MPGDVRPFARIIIEGVVTRGPMLARGVDRRLHLIALVPILQHLIELDATHRRRVAVPGVAGVGGVVKRQRGGDDLAVGGDAAEIEAQQGIVAAIPLQTQRLILAVIDAVLGRVRPIIAAHPGILHARVAIQPLLKDARVLHRGCGVHPGENDESRQREKRQQRCG